MPENYIIVYHAASDPHRLRDVGDDPCFDNPPSWGICRPNVRKWRSVQTGANLFFLAFVQPNQYYVRGWFEVGDKISYVEAYRSFPNRRNVIIRPIQNNQTLEQVIDSRIIRWRYDERKKCFKHSQLRSVPTFLISTPSGHITYVQNPDDDHEIDNWKCNRLFQCTTKQFKDCISENACHKEGRIEDEQYRHYVVANPERWVDLSELRIPWEIVETEFQFGYTLRTPINQHNALFIPPEKASALIEFLLKQKTATNSSGA